MEESKTGNPLSNGTDEHIANLQDVNNDSMFDNINQLIHDLGNGKAS